LLAVVGLLVGTSPSLISSDDVPSKDRLQTLFAAYSTVAYGVMSFEERRDAGEPIEVAPDNGREPLYPLLWAAVLALDPAEEIAAHGWSCFRVEGRCPIAIKATKAVNLVLHAAIVVAIGIGLLKMTGSGAWGLMGAAAAAASPLLLTGADDWYTETGANLFLLLHSLALFAAFQSKRPVRGAVLCGFSLGLLILVKAAFYYLFMAYAALAVAIGVVGLFQSRRGWWTISARLLIIVICTLTVIAPWMGRNLMHLGEWSVTQRGDEVLAIRSQYSTMPWSDFLPALTYFTPGVGKELLSLHFDEDTVARFDRDNPDSYYRKAKTGRSEAQRVARTEGISLQRAALAVILGNLDKHIALVPVFAYRGSAAPESLTSETLAELPVLHRQVFRWFQLAAFPLLVLSFVWLALRGPRGYLLLFVPLLFSVAFHAGLTHFIARYAAPQYAVTLFLLTFMAFLIFERLCNSWPRVKQ
jgi:hypothetical protein